MKHKHCDLIKAWADGGKVQVRRKEYDTKQKYSYKWTEWRDVPLENENG